MNTELKNFIKLSKYAGCRFDIVQSGGGNTSVKLSDGVMLIKASGINLSELNENFGYAKVINKNILDIFSKDIQCKNKQEYNKIASDLVEKANLTPNIKPSIETLLHSILKKYVLHSHPIVVNAITSRDNWKEVLKSIFGLDIALVNYKTPGIELALELKRIYKGEKIIFLQNHGLVINAETYEEVIDLTEFVLKEIEKHLGINLQKYKLTSEIYDIYVSAGITDKIPYLSCDEYLTKNINNEFIYSIPFCPDKMVYCGYKTINLTSINDILEYKKKYFDIPKVLIYKNNLFFIANNLKKAKELEDVFKFHVLSLSLYENKKINYLPDNEISYIGNWESEEYRKNI